MVRGDHSLKRSAAASADTKDDNKKPKLGNSKAPIANGKGNANGKPALRRCEEMND